MRQGEMDQGPLRCWAARYAIAMTDPVLDLERFIDASPTPYHAVMQCVEHLERAAFRPFREGEAWDLEPGVRGYVVRGQGSLIAFELGNVAAAKSGFRMVGAHTDSPNLRLKPEPERSAFGTRQLEVEPYGSALLHTWLDRDLSLAGRVFYAASDGSMACALLDFRRPLLRIPNLAIHLYKELREEGLKLNPQQHLVPVLGLEGGQRELLPLLCAELKRTGHALIPDAVRGFDLMAYDVQRASRWGAQEEFIAAPRLDDLASCHAGLCALLEAVANGPSVYTRVLVLNDHEEVGSRSARGAAGPFLAQTLERFVAGRGGADAQALPRALAHSWLISADMAHAVHPNYADRHDPQHRPVLGAGPVIKLNANQAYATDGEGVAFFRSLCAEVGVKPQLFVSRSDMACGSTIGPVAAAKLGVRTVDVGTPLWAMHSCRETAAVGDSDALSRVLTAFFGATKSASKPVGK